MLLLSSLVQRLFVLMVLLSRPKLWDPALRLARTEGRRPRRLAIVRFPFRPVAWERVLHVRRVRIGSMKNVKR